MKTYSVQLEPPRVFLAGICQSGGVSRDEAEKLTAELAGLADTLNLAIVGQETFSIRERNPRYGMGSGKAQEVAEKALASGAECIIFDREISPSQQRNWEELSGLSVMDRQELIIRIFASRARTKEAELQAELAELLYALPRLSHKYIDLSRQRGGSYGTRGAGETRLETDRRQVRQRVTFLKGEIEAVRRNRAIQRRQREKQGTPVCALVGYTNAGKSSLHRALTGSDVFVEDKLFATLDPTARRVSRQGPSGVRKTVIFVDTVGFIRRLPHNLVDAFCATLEEAAQADLLIHVLDAADPAREEHCATVMETLRVLGAGEIPLIAALNKADLLDQEERTALQASDSAVVSAINREGLESLWNLIEKTLKF
ncbi:MAG: GTPase HflX [Treponema sp.]|nr:GTPase HflX [Treponema sp.]